MAELKIKKQVSKRIQDKVNQLAKLFNAETGTIIYTNCTGKYKGCKDYSVLFNNGEEYFINCGYKYFEECLDSLIQKFTTFNNIKDRVIEVYKNLEEKDKEKSLYLNKTPYEILDIDYCKYGHYIGWFYLKLKVGDNIFNMTESGFNADIISLTESKEFNNIKFKDRSYFTAGGLNDNEVDYIFNSVGFSSLSPLYKIKNNAAFYKLAVAI